MVSELNYAARITSHYEDHSTPDLGRGHCHIGIPELRLKLKIDAACCRLGVDRKEA